MGYISQIIEDSEWFHQGTQTEQRHQGNVWADKEGGNDETIRTDL